MRIGDLKCRFKAAGQLERNPAALWKTVSFIPGVIVIVLISIRTVIK